MFKKRIANLIIPALTIATLTSCGPEQTAKEKEDAQTKQNVQAETDKLKPLGGTYRGSMLYRLSRRKAFVEMSITPSYIIVTNPSSSKSSSIATLVTSVTEIPTLTSTSVGTFIHSYNSVNFNETDGTVTFYNASNAGSGTSGSVQLSFNGKFERDRITGTLFTSLAGAVIDIDVKKVGNN